MQKLPEYLNEDFLIIKSPFMETTRKGKHLCSVNIALTSRALTITSCRQNEITGGDDSSHINLYYPLELTTLEVFKKSVRQSLKVSYNKEVIKYFELGQWKERKIFWKLWCIHVDELNTEYRIWPFVNFKNVHPIKEKKRAQWIDKYLYLGSKRAVEDNDRPTPVPGLGPTEDMKLLYLKPKYFGCWDQSEHWVQCGNSCSSVNN